MRRELSLSLKMIAPLKFNHDVVVPKGRIPELFALVERMQRSYRLRIPCFGHAGDGNIHVNIMVDPDDADEIARAHEAERVLFEGVVALEGSISGEHGIGFAKAPFLADRAVARRDRADEARQGGVRSPRHPESRQDLSMTTTAARRASASRCRWLRARAQDRRARPRHHRDRGRGDRSRDRHRARADHRRELPEVRRRGPLRRRPVLSDRAARTTRSTSRVKIAVIQAAGSRERRARVLPGHSARADERDRADAQGRHAVDGALDARHRARLVLHLRRRSARRSISAASASPTGRDSPPSARSSAAWTSCARSRPRPPTARP